MISVVIIILAFVLYYNIRKNMKDHFRNSGFIDFLCCSSAAFLLIGYSLYTINAIFFVLPQSDSIDQNIQICEQQNKFIEQYVGHTVRESIEYDKNLYGTINNIDALKLVLIFPDFMGDKPIVRQLVGRYITNCKAIRDYKDDQEYIERWRWYLYFGHS